MIKWYDPKEILPPDDAYVAVITYHWKRCWPISCEIYFGCVQSYIDEEGERKVRVNTEDFTGAGLSCYYFYRSMGDEPVVAWAHASDFEKPDFIEVNEMYKNWKLLEKPPEES